MLAEVQRLKKEQEQYRKEQQEKDEKHRKEQEAKDKELQKLREQVEALRQAANPPTHRGDASEREV